MMTDKNKDVLEAFKRLCGRLDSYKGFEDAFEDEKDIEIVLEALTERAVDVGALKDKAIAIYRVNMALENDTPGAQTNSVKKIIDILHAQGHLRTPDNLTERGHIPPTDLLTEAIGAEKTLKILGDL